MTTPSSLPRSVLRAQCQSYFRRALEALNTPPQEIYRVNLAILILQSMVGPWRFFHTFEHVLEVGGSTDPIEMLAGAFHDLVYVQVDVGVPLNLTPFISTVVQEVDGVMMLRSQLPPDPQIPWLLKLFGFEPGQRLSPLQGQNEFLSALVAVQILEPLLSVRDRLAIAVCIEATIPFRRAKRSQGLPEVTLVCLRQIVQEQALSIPETALVEMVQRSVRIANRDVLSFVQPSAADFLADTWNLLPENHHQFSPAGLYRVRDYRAAIEKTEAFFRQVNPQSIFRQFRGEPSPELYQQWQNQAAQNLAVGRLYLSCKLVAIALLEVLTEPLGDQTTLEMFMGTLPSQPDQPVFRLEQFLPPPYWSRPVPSPTEQEVWQLLFKGRAASSHQGDLVYSPLATFLVQCHGFSSVPQQRQAAKAWLAGSLSSAQFLKQFDSQCLAVLIEAISRLWDQRQQAFRTHFCPQLEMPSQSPVGGFSNKSEIQRL